MHNHSPSPFPEPGIDLGVLDLDVSAEANDRYWRGAGIDHEAREAGLLFPLMGVNFTMLLIQRTVRTGVLHTWGRIRSHAGVAAPAPLIISGHVVERWVRRSRDYFTVVSEVRDAEGDALWTLESDFAASVPREGAEDTDGVSRSLDVAVSGDAERRSLHLTDDLLRTYSRAGNFHSDDAAAQDMGLPGKVAMGMQTLGPAYGLVLERWGDDLVRAGELECRFVGMVTEDQTADARVSITDGSADIEVVNTDTATTTALAHLSL